jgi:hypothetical protein
MRNGLYGIQLVYTHPESDFGLLDANGFFLKSPGNGVLVKINNSLTFDALTSVFSSALHVKGKVNVPADGYSIQLFDSQNRSVNTLSGGIANGKIDKSWDLTGGNYPVSGPLRAEVSLSNSQKTPGGSSAAAAMDFGMEAGALNDPSFFVGWADFFATTQGDAAWSTMIQQSVVDRLANPSMHEYNLLPPENRWNSPPPFRLLDRKRSRDYFLNQLVSADCFFFTAHTTEKLLTPNGRDSGLPAPKFPVLAFQVAEKRGLPFPGQKPHPTPTVPRPFRLAILYGCHSYSFEWATAFGTRYSSAGGSETVDSYQISGRAPRAFVGWDTEVVSASGANGTGLGFAALMDDWMGGLTIEQCMNSFGANTTGWLGAWSWKISGCTDLRRQQWW